MKAPAEILDTWRKFDDFPMETLTKVWNYRKTGVKTQRDLSTMKHHRSRYGNTGNCFDLAIWLLDEFENDGVKAYPIGSCLLTEEVHVAVVAEDGQGAKYLCDLGDQWIQPILIDPARENFTKDKLCGFFPGAKVQVLPGAKDEVEILYYRPNGKVSRQIYEIHPIEMEVWEKSAEICQQTISPVPLFECRIERGNEVVHWEFSNWESFISTSVGLEQEPPLSTVEEWAERIHRRSGYNKDFLIEALSFYKGY